MLADHLAELDPAELTGLTCLADGPDTWFADLVLAHGGRLEAVIPATDYRNQLPAWHHADYDRLLAAASVTHETGLSESDSRAHQAGIELLIDHADALLAVWAGLPARGPGGTADAVAYAEGVGVRVTVLWPAGARR